MNIPEKALENQKSPYIDDKTLQTNKKLNKGFTFLQMADNMTIVYDEKKYGLNNIKNGNIGIEADTNKKPNNLKRNTLNADEFFIRPKSYRSMNDCFKPIAIVPQEQFDNTIISDEPFDNSKKPFPQIKTEEKNLEDKSHTKFQQPLIHCNKPKLRRSLQETNHPHNKIASEVDRLIFLSPQQQRMAQSRKFFQDQLLVDNKFTKAHKESTQISKSQIKNPNFDLEIGKKKNLGLESESSNKFRKNKKDGFDIQNNQMNSRISRDDIHDKIYDAKDGKPMKFKTIEEWKKYLAGDNKYQIFINNKRESEVKLYDSDANFVDMPYDQESRMLQVRTVDFYPTESDIIKKKREKDYIMQGISKTQSLSPNLQHYEQTSAKQTSTMKFRSRSISNFLLSSKDIKNKNIKDNARKIHKKERVMSKMKRFVNVNKFVCQSAKSIDTNPIETVENTKKFSFKKSEKTLQTFVFKNPAKFGKRDNKFDSNLKSQTVQKLSTKVQVESIASLKTDENSQGLRDHSNSKKKKNRKIKKMDERKASIEDQLECKSQNDQHNNSNLKPKKITSKNNISLTDSLQPKSVTSINSRQSIEHKKEKSMSVKILDIQNNDSEKYNPSLRNTQNQKLLSAQEFQEQNDPNITHYYKYKLEKELKWKHKDHKNQIFLNQCEKHLEDHSKKIQFKFNTRNLSIENQRKLSEYIEKKEGKNAQNSTKIVIKSDLPTSLRSLRPKTSNPNFRITVPSIIPKSMNNLDVITDTQKHLSFAIPRKSHEILPNTINLHNKSKNSETKIFKLRHNSKSKDPKRHHVPENGFANNTGNNFYKLDPSSRLN